MSLWWHQRSLKTKGLFVLALAMLPLVAALLALTANMRAIYKIDSRLPIDRQVRLQEAQLVKLTLDAETAVRGYLLTGQPRFLQRYQEASSSVPEVLTEVQEHLGSGRHSARAQQLATLTEQELSLLAILVEEGPNDARLNQASRVMDEFRAAMVEIQAIEDRQIRRAVTERDVLRRRQTQLLLGSIAAGAIGGGLAAMLLLGGIVRRVRAVTANAGRLAEGAELAPREGGKDELSQMEIRLAQTAALLRGRENALRAAKEEAESANRSKSEFLSRVSHELRTPLNAILGFAQVVRSEASDRSTEDLDQILRAGRHLLDLIDEVLDISRIEAGHMSLSVEPVSVADLVNESMALLQPLAVDEDVTIDLDGAAVTGAAVLADRQRLKQVLLNLLSNAIKYNVKKGTVQLGVQRHDGRVTISVADSGVGIPQASLERLFIPFDRLDAEAKGVEGTGLGLALSARLVEAMQGELEVQSEVGSGTTFKVTLPEAPLPEEAGRSYAWTRQQGPPAETAASILYIDDNPSNVKLVERILAKTFGGRLLSAMQGGTGLELADKHSPDVIMLDLHLPDIPGEVVLQRLRSQPSTRHIPVIIVSADAMPSQIARLKELGADAYVTKPFEIATLVDRIRTALSEERSAV